MVDPMMPQVVIVTGASSGIGEATALALDQAGFAVYAGARRLDRMAGLAERGITVAELDVTDEGSMVAFVDRVLADRGQVDVLINNAGYGSYGAVEDVPLDEGRRQFEVNLFGLARMTQLVTPSMRAAGSGRIVNISSMGGHFGEALGAWYHASKFAVEGFSDSLRLELHEFGIRGDHHRARPDPHRVGRRRVRQRPEVLRRGRVRRPGEGDEGPLRPGRPARRRAVGHRGRHPSTP